MGGGPPASLGDSAVITELKKGELRRVVQIFPETDSNVIFVRRDDDKFVSVIDARQSDEDPTRVLNDWLVSDDLPDLYRQIGESFQGPSMVRRGKWI